MDYLTPALLIGVAGILGKVLHEYTKIQVKLKELEIRVTQNEKQDTRIEDKIDKLFDSVSSMRAELSQKEDRE